VLAEAYAHTHEYASAQAEMDKAVALMGGGGAEVRADVGYIYAVSGRKADAATVVADLENRFRQHDEGAAGALAVVFAGLGNVDRAMTYLDQARELRDPVLPDLKTDPRFDALRSDARFDKLLASLGFAR
jgi:Flp pilus assembly protein TadD